MDRREAALLQAVDRLNEEMIDFAARLVAEPSTLGNEASVLQVMEQQMRDLGYPPRRVGVDPVALAGHPGFAPVPWDYQGRYNLAAVRPADGAGGKSALFNGHLDVVSEQPIEGWRRDPYCPEIEQGWLYGRGAGDMKAGVAAIVYALAAVDRAGLGLAAPVTLEVVIEEECSGNGALACLAAGYDAEAVLIPEPFGPTILTSQVGVCWFKVQVKGVPKHALDTGGGVNAIEKCYPLIAALRELERSLNAEPHPAFPGISHPFNFNLGVLKGGDWPSTVPAFAEFHGRLGFPPGLSYEDIRALVERALDQTAQHDPWLAAHRPSLEFYGFRSQGHQVPMELEALRLLGRCHQDLSGSPAAEFHSTATTDLRAFVHYGRGQATCFGPLAENIHASNERVNLQSVLHTARTYALFLSRWCGLVD
ncbi:MAG: ArgE/DapE family deacylase [Desulfarculus sp.]|jgi:acetylornithine deacetylase|nr:MAG: ArgE/DapE family deacylase [Desulfarculus sp.]